MTTCQKIEIEKNLYETGQIGLSQMSENIIEILNKGGGCKDEKKLISFDGLMDQIFGSK